MNENSKAYLFVVFFGIICFSAGFIISGFIGRAKDQKSFIELESKLSDLGKELDEERGRNSELGRILDESKESNETMAKLILEQAERNREIGIIIDSLGAEHREEGRIFEEGREIFKELETILDSHSSN